MGIYVFSRDVLLEMLEQPGIDFGKELIPHALTTREVNPYIFRGYWADVGTIDAFYEANIQLTRSGAPFNFFHPRFPIYTHPRFLPGTRVYNSRIDSSIVTEGCYLDECEVRDSVVGIRTHVNAGAKITRSVLLGADFYEEETTAAETPLGIGRDVVLDRVIVDKNARIADGVRLVNESGVNNADGDGYYIREGIIIVPKGGEVKAGVAV
jgi:glucose-1-phosphate adenylyltransferase